MRNKPFIRKWWSASQIQYLLDNYNDGRKKALLTLPTNLFDQHPSTSLV